MKEKIFKQVFIKSESDLPKKTGNYFAFQHNLNEITNIHIFPGNKDSSKRWMKEIDWYLIEIEEKQQEQPVYDEKYLNECIEKATPNLSKIKDVDIILDEIKGREPQSSPKVSAEEWLNENYREFIIHCKNTGRSIEFFSKMIQSYHNQFTSQQEENGITK
jgi:hypothetical protein